MLTPVNTPRLILRRPFESDADEFFELIHDEETCRLAGFPHCETPDALYHAGFLMLWRDIENRLFVVVPGDGRMVGSIHVVPENSTREALVHIVLHPDYRRLGYGTECLNALFEQLAAASFHAVSCTCTEDNEGAVSFFRSLGFLPCGEASSRRMTRSL